MSSYYTAAVAVFLLAAASFNLSDSAQFTTETCGWSAWFSEEGDGDWQPHSSSDPFWDHPVTGMQCRGRYCDDLSVQNCKQGEDKDQTASVLPVDLIADPDSQCGWTKAAHSREAANGAVQCPNGQFVSSMLCQGTDKQFRYCNDIKLRCCPTNNKVWVVHTDGDTSVSNSFSEEDGKQVCPANKVIIGLECEGKFCDNHKFTCAPFTLSITSGTDQPVAGWTVFCTGPASAICATHVDETVTSTFTTTDSTNWQISMQASFELGFEFLGVGGKETFTLGSHLGGTISKAFSQAHSESHGCEVKVSYDPKCVTNTTYNLVVWHFEATTSFAGYLQGKTSTVNTCLTYVTSSSKIQPRCLPGLCADCECQKCLTKDQAEAKQDAQKNMGLLHLLSK